MAPRQKTPTRIAPTSTIATEVDSAPVDAGTLAQLRAEGDNLLSDLIEIYNTETPANLQSLAQALAAGNSGAAALAAHTLKGTATTFGAKCMQALALEIEQAARAGSIEKATAQLNQFRAECDRVRDALSREQRSG